MPTQVPFFDLKRQHAGIGQEIDGAIRRVCRDSQFSGGSNVSSFECQFAEYCGVSHAIGVGSGTDALWLSLMALGIGPGDEVITVPNSFIATAEAIQLCGAKPAFVDIDPKSFNMDPCRLKQAINPRTKAIIPVHLYGQPAAMDPILDVARFYGLHVIEDACQAHGAEYRGQKVGTLGQVGCFSFYPSKNLGAYGEAGAVVTNDPQIDKRIREMRNHGQSQKHEHEEFGTNSRMDSIQAAVLQVKLKYLDRWNDNRRSIASEYLTKLKDVNDFLFQGLLDATHPVYHLCALRTPDRDRLRAHLQDHGIETAIHYPKPIHLQKAFRWLELEPGSFPIAEQFAKEIVSIPMFPEMTTEEIHKVIEALHSFSKTRGSIPKLETVLAR